MTTRHGPATALPATPHTGHTFSWCENGHWEEWLLHILLQTSSRSQDSSQLRSLLNRKSPENIFTSQPKTWAQHCSNTQGWHPLRAHPTPIPMGQVQGSVLLPPVKFCLLSFYPQSNKADQPQRGKQETIKALHLATGGTEVEALMLWQPVATCGTLCAHCHGHRKQEKIIQLSSLQILGDLRKPTEVVVASLNMYMSPESTPIHLCPYFCVSFLSASEAAMTHGSAPASASPISG